MPEIIPAHPVQQDTGWFRVGSKSGEGFLILLVGGFRSQDTRQVALESRHIGLAAVPYLGILGGG